MRGRVLVFLVLALLLGAGVYLWRSSRSPAGAEDRTAGFALLRARRQTPAAPVWKTEPARRGRLQATISATGEVASARSTVLFWQTSGLVAETVQVGDRVQRGDVLARLDPDTLPQALLSAQAQLLQLEQQLEQLRLIGEARAYNDYAQARYQEDRARKNLESLYDKIADGEAVSEITLERYKSAYALAQKQRAYAEQVYQQWKEGNPPELAQLEAQIRALKAQLATATLTAPFTGTVTQVYTEAGTWVQPGMQALRLDDTRTLYVLVGVNEFDAPQVQPDLEAEITFDGIPYTTYHGVVERVDPVATVNPRSGITEFRVRIRLTDADQRLRLGMNAAVTIYGPVVEDALLVPARAVRVIEGQPTVYVLRGGQPTPVAVRLGLSGETYVQILDGELQEGDPVVLNPPTENPFGP